MTFNKYIKAILGLRYSYISSQDGTSAGPTTGDAWNPMLGIMLTPIKNINLFRFIYNYYQPSPCSQTNGERR